MWRLTWGAHDWTESDLTGEHAAVMSIVARDATWTPIESTPLDGPVPLMCWLATFVAVAEGRNPFEVQAEIARMPLVELMAAIA